MNFYIEKSSGEKEKFNIKKFQSSLKRAGTDKNLIDDIIQEVKHKKFKTSHDVYDFAYKILSKTDKGAAARYNLKQALLELGPSGYPFEEFIGRIFEKEGYSTKYGQIVPGFCVSHELDLVLNKKDAQSGPCGIRHSMVECKFHNNLRYKSDVKIPLYIQARFEDVKKRWEQNNEEKCHFHEAWLVTNTKFTSEALTYANCVKIKMISWNYPTKFNLPYFINKYALHPITALKSLTGNEKRNLLKNNIVLCSEAVKSKNRLKNLGFKEDKINTLVQEASLTCNYP